MDEGKAYEAGYGEAILDVRDLIHSEILKAKTEIRQQYLKDLQKKVLNLDTKQGEG